MGKSIISEVRQRIDHQGERFWRLADFQDLPTGAVAKALSRLAQKGHLKRLSKGVYYRGRPTAFGVSRPNLTLLQGLAAEKSPIFPAGLSAASMLGFTTQMSQQNEVATSALSLPRKLLGPDTIIHRMRPAAWGDLSADDAAMLELLRARAKTSELSAPDTIKRVLAHFSNSERFERIMQVAFTEPPRVRAMLGAIAQQLRKPRLILDRLKASLNPLSRFDFGVLSELQHAKNWNAKARK